MACGAPLFCRPALTLRRTIASRARQVPAVGDSQVDHRLLLLGDAGEPSSNGEPALEVLGHQARLMPERTTVVFLGDNVYERGMPDPIEPEKAALDTAAAAADVVLPDVFDSRKEAERHLNAQIDVVRRRQPGARHLHPRQPRLGSVRERRLETHPQPGAVSAE